MKKFILLFLFLAYNFIIVSADLNKVWDWDKLRQRPYPQWFTDAKFGIFIHWGVYSVPAYTYRNAYAEWFLRGLQAGDTLKINFMKRVYGENFTYRDFAKLFKAELWNPDEWAKLFKEAGAKYVVLVSKHHDGYCLWPSKYASGWNSVDVGPKRDIVGELTKAVRDNGLIMGLYYSLPEWNNKLFRWYTDPNDKVKEYVDKHMIPQLKELITLYKPTLLFTDGEWFHKASDWHAQEMISFYYNTVGDSAIVNDRWGAGSNIGFRTPEYSSGIENSDRPWAEIRSIGRSFGLNRNEKLTDYLTAKEIIEILSKAVANGGGLILNVGPKADGQIPLIQQERLYQVGNWLKKYGEAIYGTEKFYKTGEKKVFYLQRIDTLLDFHWGRNTPGKPITEDFFHAKWSGFIKVKQHGKYYFKCLADDSAKVIIANKLVIDSKNKNSKNNIKLKKDIFYPIEIEYYEKQVEAFFSFLISQDNKNFQPVGKNLLYTDKSSKIHGLKAVYSSEDFYINYIKKDKDLYIIFYDFPQNNKLTLNISKPYSNDCKIIFLADNSELRSEFVNDKLEIDLSTIKCKNLLNNLAYVIKIKNYF